MFLCLAFANIFSEPQPDGYWSAYTFWQNSPILVNKLSVYFFHYQTPRVTRHNQMRHWKEQVMILGLNSLLWLKTEVVPIVLA